MSELRLLLKYLLVSLHSLGILGDYWCNFCSTTDNWEDFGLRVTFVFFVSFFYFTFCKIGSHKRIIRLYREIF